MSVQFCLIISIFLFESGSKQGVHCVPLCLLHLCHLSPFLMTFVFYWTSSLACRISLVVMSHMFLCPPLFFWKLVGKPRGHYSGENASQVMLLHHGGRPVLLLMMSRLKVGSGAGGKMHLLQSFLSTFTCGLSSADHHCLHPLLIRHWKTVNSQLYHQFSIFSWNFSVRKSFPLSTVWFLWYTISTEEAGKPSILCLFLPFKPISA